MAGADRAVELPAHDGDVEARAGARRRLRRRAQARSADAAHAPSGSPSSPREVGFPAGRAQRRPGRRPDDRRLPRPASRRRQGRVHRLDEDGRRDHAARLRPGEARHARARRQEPERRLRGRRIWPTRSRARSGRSTTRPGRAARRARASSSRRPLYDEVVAQFAEAGREGQGRRPARRRDADGLADLDRPTATGCTASSSAAREAGAEVVTGGEVPDGPGAFYPPRSSRASTTRMRSRRRRSSARSSR